MDDFQDKLLNFIVHQWRSLSKARRPPHLWIRQYDSQQAHADLMIDLHQMPVAVWFVEENGVQQRSICEWSRFAAVQFNNTWNRRLNEQNPILGRSVFEIGLAAFAPLENSKKYYVEWQWGGLNGNGLIVSVNANNSVEFDYEIWIS